MIEIMKMEIKGIEEWSDKYILIGYDGPVVNSPVTIVHYSKEFGIIPHIGNNYIQYIDHSVKITKGD